MHLARLEPMGVEPMTFCMPSDIYLVLHIRNPLEIMLHEKNANFNCFLQKRLILAHFE